MMRKISKSYVGRFFIAWHHFRLRYRWVFALVVITAIIVLAFSGGELVKVVLGLGLEQAIIRFGEAAKVAAEAAAEAAEVAAESV